MEKTERIEIIQIVRLLGAVCIILYHSQLIGEHGYFGVELFSIISGYVMIYSTQKKESMNYFLRKRLIRIIPLYWLMTILVYVIVSKYPELSIMCEAKPEYLIKSMLFIPFCNSRGFNVPILGVGWTLNYEMLFCLIFFVAMRLNHAYRGAIAFFLTIILAIVGQFRAGYYTDLFLLEFSFGIASFYIVRYMQKKLKNQSFQKIYFILAAASFIWMFLDLTRQSPWHRCFRVGIPALIFFCSILLSSREIRINRKLLKLGNMSFSIYLVEYFTTALYKLVVYNWSFALKVLAFFIMLGITIIISYIPYQMIEVKLTGWLRKQLCRL